MTRIHPSVLCLVLFTACSHPVHIVPYTAQTLPQDQGNPEVQAIYPMVRDAIAKNYREWHVTRIIARDDAFRDYVDRYGIRKRAISVFWTGQSTAGTCAVGIAEVIQSSSAAGWAHPTVEIWGYIRRKELPGFKPEDGEPLVFEQVGGNSLLPAECEAITQR